MDINDNQQVVEEAPLTSSQKRNIYIASVLLAPLGLFWFFKYYKSKSPDRHKIAFKVLFITIFMIVALVAINALFIGSVMNYLNMYKQTMGLEGLSY